jgi:hypothetical protein
MTAELASIISTRWALLVIIDYNFVHSLGMYITFWTGKKRTVENRCESQRIPNLIFTAHHTLKETTNIERNSFVFKHVPIRTFGTPRGAVLVVSSPAAYCSTSGLKSRPGDRLALFIFRRVWQSVLKSNAGTMHQKMLRPPHLRIFPSYYSLPNHHTTQFCIIWVTAASLYKP